MKRLYLHIGHYKTGTSAIQKYCSDNADFLRQNGYHYPPVARVGDNHADLSLTLAAKHGFTPPPWYSNTKDIDQVYDGLLADIRSAEQQNILISSEEFFQLALRENSEAAIIELKERLAEFDVKIVLYIREPMALLKSWYNEVNKGPFGTRTFPVFFKGLNPHFLSQRAVYGKFADVFGADRMIVRTYRLTGMAHIHDFLAGIGCKAQLAATATDSTVNEGQGLELIELARLSKERRHSYEKATTSQVGSLAQLGIRVDNINAAFAKLSTISDVPVPSQLSLANIFRHHQALSMSLIEGRCINNQEASVLRDAAESVQAKDIELATVLMQTAHLIRPGGAYIKRLLREYESRAQEDT